MLHFCCCSGHDDEILDLAFDATGQQLATASADGTYTCISSLLYCLCCIHFVSFVVFFLLDFRCSWVFIQAYFDFFWGVEFNSNCVVSRDGQGIQHVHIELCLQTSGTQGRGLQGNHCNSSMHPVAWGCV